MVETHVKAALWAWMTPAMMAVSGCSGMAFFSNAPESNPVETAQEAGLSPAPSPAATRTEIPSWEAWKPQRVDGVPLPVERWRVDAARAMQQRTFDAHFDATSLVAEESLGVIPENDNPAAEEEEDTRDRWYLRMEKSVRQGVNDLRDWLK